MCVAVIYGGMSSEHSVSCVTAGAIMAHLDPDRYDVIPIGITRDGTWTVGTTNPDELTIHDGALPEVGGGDEVRISTSPQRRGQIHYVSGAHAGQLLGVADVVFPALHGRYGEDGTIQGLLELSGVPYVGVGVLASAACMDKECTKMLLRDAGLSVAPQVILRGDDELTDDDQQLLGLPVYVKPANGGSSIGVSRVTDWADLDAALAVARAEDDKVLIESELHGPEVEVGVLEYPDGRVVASVPAQLSGTTESEEGFYGFDTKYLAHTVHAEIPAPLPESTISELTAMAITAFHAVGGTGLSRVDFFATPTGPVVNEINTMPGFTPISMYPQVFAASGIAYGELLTTLIDTALVRHPQRSVPAEA